MLSDTTTWIPPTTPRTVVIDRAYPKGNRPQGPIDHGTAPFLQAKSDGKEPPHAWVEAVERAQDEQHNPRPEGRPTHG